MDDIIQILKRERLARKAAEKLMEEKSLELYKTNQSLIQLNESLEIKVRERTEEVEKRTNQLSVLFEKNPFPMLV